MKKTFATALALAALSAALVSCTSTSSVYQNVPGHPYKTDQSCVRTVPLGKFDRVCDQPLVGFKGFSADVIVPQVGGGAGGGL